MLSSQVNRSGEPSVFDQVVLHVTVMFATIGLGVILALLAELQAAIGFESASLGLVAGSSFLFAFLSYLTIARLADRGHAKAMLVAGTAVAAVALLAAAYATSLAALVAARALLGVAEGAIIPAARRIVLDWAPDRPGAVLGRILSASVAGFVAGPALGAVLAAPFGLRAPFVVPALVLVAALPVIGRLAVPAITGRGEHAPASRWFARPVVLGGLLFGVLDFATFGALDSVWARLLTDVGASTTFIGVSLTLTVLPMVPAASWFGRLVDGRGPGPVSLIGIVLIVPAVMTYATSSSKVVIAAGGLLHGIGSAALAPAAAAMVAAGSPRRHLARGQGLLEASGYLAAALAALPAGWVYARAGKFTLFATLAAVAAALYATARLISNRERQVGG
jgi:MFS family permease